MVRLVSLCRNTPRGAVQQTVALPGMERHVFAGTVATVVLPAKVRDIAQLLKEQHHLATGMHAARLR